MLGLGLSGYVPYVVYGLSFLVAFLAVFYRSSIGILFLVPLFPLYVILDKVLKSGLFLANSVTDMVIIGMTLGLFVQGSRDEKHPLGSAPQLLPIFLFVGYTLVSFINGTFFLDGDFSSVMNMERLADWKNYIIMPVLYVLTYYTLRERKWKYALFILIFISLLAADFKFRQTFRWYDHTRYQETSRSGDTFAFLNANAWGAFHAMYTLFLMGLFLMDKDKWRRVAYGILIAGGIYSLMYSYSRGAYVGFAVGLVFIALVKSRKLLIPLFLLLLLWKLVLPSSVVDRIEGTFVEESDRTGVITIGDTNLSTAYRSEIWQDAWSIFMENPVVGTGFRTFGKLTGWDTHNQYLKTLSEQGIIGFLIYLLLYQRAFISGWRLYKEGDEDLLRAFGFAFVCAVLGSMVVNVFGDRWTYLQIGAMYWVFWALVDQENSRLRIQKQELAALSEGESINLTRVLNSKALP